MKRLQDILDKASFDILVKNFGGTRIWIPKEGNVGHHNPAYFKQRNIEIRRYYRKCQNIKEVAKKFKLCTSRVYSLVGNY